MKRPIESDPGPTSLGSLVLPDNLVELELSAPFPESAEIVRINRHITFSKLERRLYQIRGVEPKGLVGRELTAGTAIDEFLILANFVYRYRALFCRRDNEDWTAEDAFWKFLPTAYRSVKEKLFAKGFN